MRCDACGKFRRECDMEIITVAISYNCGPMSQMLCKFCTGNQRTAGDKFRTGGTPDV